MFYHASQSHGLKTLIPQGKSKRHLFDPPRVYVASSPVVAVAFMVNPVDDWYIHGSYDDGKTWVLVVSGEHHFWEEERRGGSLYGVLETGFRNDPDVGLREHEWYATTPVPIVWEVVWPSAFAAMRHYGLKVCFIPDGTIEKFRSVVGQAPLVQLAQPRGDGTFDIPRWF